MLARDLIKDEIPPLKTSDTGLKALNWMEEFRVSHLPIVNNVHFLGLVSDEDILNLNKPEEPLGNHPLSLLRPYVKSDQHLYEVLKIVANLKLTVIPVLDEEQHYMGLITLPELVQNFSSMRAVQDPGGILVLELNQHDFALSEIAQIIESEDAKILSCAITSRFDMNKLEVTIKLNKMDLSRILASFYRHNYNVKSYYHQSEFSDDIQSRLDSFLNYLNI
jgi:Mg/Co/Ni transporter MgtE